MKDGGREAADDHWLAGNDLQWDLSAQAQPEVEFDQRLAWQTNDFPLVKSLHVPATESLPGFRAGSTNPGRYAHSHRRLQLFSRLGDENGA